MKVAELFVKCLENEGVSTIFGVPGEENLDVMDALLGSSIRFITTRHEQGAAFMADVHGRLTGEAGVCLATLGPGATNLITGVADANLDRAPVVAIAGQASTNRLHKESHQVLDLVNMFAPITKYSAQILEPSIVTEVVRKAFKVAQAEKPGAAFIDLPENIAAMDAGDKLPLKAQKPMMPSPPLEKIRQAAALIAKAKSPIVLAGNGVIRARAHQALFSFARTLNIPVANTFMAKGVLSFSNPMSLGTVGLQSRDIVSCAFDNADVIICVGFDMVEYHPNLWHQDIKKKIIHIDMSPAEVDEYYILECGVVGDISIALNMLIEETNKVNQQAQQAVRNMIVAEMEVYANDTGFPIKPQKIVWDLRQALRPHDICISDVGAHKMWMARMFQAQLPNTCIISNGFASMGIAVPGAIGAKLIYPDRVVIAVTGDAGFLMNCQEIETAMRVQTPIIILVWNDSKYGLIEWKQLIHFGRDSNIDFKNPDFIKFAESFGAKGYRVKSAKDLIPTIRQAIKDNTVVIIDVPVDYRENMKLTEALKHITCPRETS
jgi:acetolactate synthase-1/2/3 large subunit